MCFQWESDYADVKVYVDHFDRFNAIMLFVTCYYVDEISRGYERIIVK